MYPFLAWRQITKPLLISASFSSLAPYIYSWLLAGYISTPLAIISDVTGDTPALLTSNDDTFGLIVPSSTVRVTPDDLRCHLAPGLMRVTTSQVRVITCHYVTGWLGLGEDSQQWQRTKILANNNWKCQDHVAESWVLLRRVWIKYLLHTSHHIHHARCSQQLLLLGAISSCEASLLTL